MVHQPLKRNSKQSFSQYLGNPIEKILYQSKQATTQLLLQYFYEKQLSKRVCESISRPEPIMASKAKPNPCWIGDRFGRKKTLLMPEYRQDLQDKNNCFY